MYRKSKTLVTFPSSQMRSERCIIIGYTKARRKAPFYIVRFFWLLGAQLILPPSSQQEALF